MNCFRRTPLLVAVVVLAGCSHKAAVGPKVDPALETLIPEDTTLLVGTRLEALQKTPVYQKYLADRKFPQVEEFAKQTGLDPEKDLWELLFVSNGKNNVLLGRGKFANEMEPRLEKGGAKRFGYKGYNLIGDEKAAVVFISSTTAAMGPTESLRYLLDQRGASKGPPAALAALMKDIPAEAQFWAVYAGGPVELGFTGNLANINKLVGSIQTGSVYFDLRTGLSGVASGECSTDQSAEEVQGALKAFVGLGRLNTPANQPEMQAAWDGLRTTLQDKRVKLYIDVPQNVVDQFLALWMGRKR
ncbi:MAG TPA: hypothetical protein VK752_30630 [Bryobacteraceae bacterium]|nr:hypothetical protein [Bryobacteraceae bacterium]